MADESKFREQQDRGERARLVLQELEEAFKSLESDCYEVFRNSDMHDDVGRRSCRFYLRVLDDIKGRFERAVTTGEAARKELVRLKNPSKLRGIVNG